MTNLGCGVDIGGSGIKGALVDLDTGQFVTDRIKILTPQPATPRAVAEVVGDIVEQLGWSDSVGITLPATVREQIACSAANIDPSWIGTDLQELFGRALPHREITVLNDADAAGLAEVAYGDERARRGAVIFLTFGTGIGSAFLLNGQLFPNTELGHLEVNGKIAERRASAAARERHEWSYERWAKEVSKVLEVYEKLFSPGLFIAGGGISRKAERWIPKLSNRVEVIPAQLRNTAGIVGAAQAADSGLRP